eukprot:bmy_06193T0
MDPQKLYTRCTTKRGTGVRSSAPGAATLLLPPGIRTQDRTEGGCCSCRHHPHLLGEEPAFCDRPAEDHRIFHVDNCPVHHNKENIDKFKGYVIGLSLSALV